MRVHLISYSLGDVDRMLDFIIMIAFERSDAYNLIIVIGLLATGF